MDREELIEFLKENLSIETRTESNYTGGMDGSGQMYRDSVSIRLVLCGETISSDSL